MNWIDLAILLVLASFVVGGWRAGFIIVMGKLVSLVVAVIAAAYAMTWLSGLFDVTWAEHPVGAVIAFITIAGLASRLVMLAFALLHQAWRVVSIIPFMGPLNRLFGAVAGFAKGVVVLVAVAYLLNVLPLGGFADEINASTFMTMLRTAASSITVVLPM